ncbi:DUF3489 domain-containing protein [Mesorhizobium sp. M0293]|uniref:hypothetical protein n=1 Tax=Mesorhizobium sp. M0293 TaxID=2956930 RepID=UPI0033390543
MTTETETTAPSILAAIAKVAKAPKAPKADKPAKAPKAAKPAKEKPAKAAKAKPAPKPRKEKPMTETAPATPEVDPIDALLAEFGSVSFDDKDFLRAMLQKAYDAGKNAKKARAPRAGGPSKAEQAAELLRRPEGATTKDILDLTKWPAVSVPAIARSAGLTLRQEKDGRVTRYFGTAVTPA